MQLIRASVLTRYMGRYGRLNDTKVVTDVSVKQVARSEYESACRSIKIGEVISTGACTTDLAVADFIHVVAVKVQGLTIGKLHLKFYKEHRKVKRTFVALEPQVRKLLCKKRDRVALTMVDWLGDKSQEVIDQIAMQTIREIEGIAVSTPTNAKVQSAPKADLSLKLGQPVDRTVQKVGTKIPTSNAMKAFNGAVKRRVLGNETRGVVVESGIVRRTGDNGDYSTFCLKLDVNGKFVPIYGVELERECLERGVKPGDLVQVISMGRQDLGDGKHRNLFHVNVQ